MKNRFINLNRKYRVNTSALPKTTVAEVVPLPVSRHVPVPVPSPAPISLVISEPLMASVEEHIAFINELKVEHEKERVDMKVLNDKLNNAAPQDVKDIISEISTTRQMYAERYRTLTTNINAMFQSNN